MTYLLFFLSLGLITALILVFKRSREHRKQLTILQQKLKEADRKIKDKEQIYEQLIRELNDQINILEDRRKSLHEPDKIKFLQEKIKNKSRKIRAAQQLNERLKEEFKTLQNQFDQLNIEKLNWRLETSKLKEITEEKEKAIQKANDLYKDIESEIDSKTVEFRESIKILEMANDQLMKENQSLKAGGLPTTDNFIVLKSREQDFYPYEKREILLDTLEKSLGNVHKNSRRWDILRDIISNNPSDSRREAIRQELQNLFQDYKNMNRGMRNNLEKMGFEIVAENNHYKMIYYGDSRYMITFAKTPGDWRAGRNIMSEICNLLL